MKWIKRSVEILLDDAGHTRGVVLARSRGDNEGVSMIGTGRRTNEYYMKNKRDLMGQIVKDVRGWEQE